MSALGCRTAPCARALAGALLLLALAACAKSPTSEEPPAYGTHPAGTLFARTVLSGRPFGVAVGATGVVYVTRLDADSLARFDLPDTSLRAGVLVGAVPTDVAFGPTGATAFVANQASGSLGIVSTGTDTQIAAVPLGAGDPFKVLVSPSGDRVYVGTNAGVVVAVNPGTQAVVRTTPVGSDPNGLAFHPDGRHLYVSNYSSGSVSELLTDSASWLRSLQVGGTPQGIAVSRDGAELWVANGFGFVSVLDRFTGARTDSLPLTYDGFALAITPDGKQVYVGMRSAGMVRVYDRATRAVVKDIATGGVPRRIAFSADGTWAVIANEAGWVDFVR